LSRCRPERTRSTTMEAQPAVLVRSYKVGEEVPHSELPGLDWTMVRQDTLRAPEDRSWRWRGSLSWLAR
jgi:hypothetical protein